MPFVHHSEVTMRTMFRSTFMKFAALAGVVAALAFMLGVGRWG